MMPKINVRTSSPPLPRQEAPYATPRLTKRVLLSGLDFDWPTRTTSSTSPPATTTREPGPKRESPACAIGLGIGLGVFCILAVIVIAVAKRRRSARSQSLEDGSEQIVGSGGMQDVALRDVHPVSRRKAGQRWTEDVHRHHRHENGNGQRSNRRGDRQDVDDGICLGR